MLGFRFQTSLLAFGPKSVGLRRTPKHPATRKEKTSGTQGISISTSRGLFISNTIEGELSLLERRGLLNLLKMMV